mmetsp:Transcript_2946/g.7969  ORF Transcript_2946/g.7969 Transcript_2946/m.7969 type:complete len:225 (-) Transcript_2946:2194-2868(-)
MHQRDNSKRSGWIIPLVGIVRTHALHPQTWDALVLAVAPVRRSVDHSGSARSVDLHAARPVVIVAVLGVELGVVPLAGVTPAAKDALVRAQGDLVGPGLEAPHPVIGVRVARMEVENENQIPLLEHDQLVHLVLAGDVGVRSVDKSERFVQMHQGPVVRVHVLVLEGLGIREIPPSPALVVGSPVAWNELSRGGVVRVIPRKVDPLRVAKLVAHEIQVPLAAKG